MLGACRVNLRVTTWSILYRPIYGLLASLARLWPDLELRNRWPPAATLSLTLIRRQDFDRLAAVLSPRRRFLQLCRESGIRSNVFFSPTGSAPRLDVPEMDSLAGRASFQQSSFLELRFLRCSLPIFSGRFVRAGAWMSALPHGHVFRRTCATQILHTWSAVTSLCLLPPTFLSSTLTKLCRSLLCLPPRKSPFAHRSTMNPSKREAVVLSMYSGPLLTLLGSAVQELLQSLATSNQMSYDPFQVKLEPPASEGASIVGAPVGSASTHSTDLLPGVSQPEPSLYSGASSGIDPTHNAVHPGMLPCMPPMMPSMASWMPQHAHLTAPPTSWMPSYMHPSFYVSYFRYLEFALTSPDLLLPSLLPGTGL